MGNHGVAAARDRAGYNAGIRPGIRGKSSLIQSALVANTQTVIVPARGVCPDLVLRPAAVQLAIPGDIVMIADVGEPTILVCASKRFHWKNPGRSGLRCSELREV